MPRLFRPYIPLEVRCRVAMRQLGEIWPDDALRTWKEAGGTERAMLDGLLVKLAGLLACEVKGLRLDHNPALGARPVVPLRGKPPAGHRHFNAFGVALRYDPDANDPEHLIYREKRAHEIKTNVRGEHGQHPDRVLIKKERRRAKRARCKLDSRKGRLRSTHASVSAAKVRRRKVKRPLRSASRWPPRGSRKVNWRKTK